MNIVPPAGWKISDWSGDWFERDSWMASSDKPFNDQIQYRRYGGDLQGVLDKLDYLSELGITAIYLNPINDAPSLHKYDARNYHHVDVNFGPDPQGDMQLIASENPADPTTWKWTSADKLFLKLIEQARSRGIRIIMDYSWNHTGTNFWAWTDVLQNQQKSPYKDWYSIEQFDNPETAVNEFKYAGWYNLAYLPEFKKTELQTERISGKPYEGNMNEGVKQHIFDVSKRWLAPDGDTSRGVAGFRLDVADQIGMGFWRDYRKFVRSVKGDAYLIGEIWWEKWPEILMDPTPYMQGDIFDAVMFYQVYRPARYFFAKTDSPIDAAQLKDSLQLQWNRLKPQSVKAMMNVSSSHDAPRLLSDFFNPNRYKYHANPNENKAYKTGKPDAETYQRLKLYLTHLFTSLGAPQIWNGDEMGMWGADDPYGRKPLWWSDMTFEYEPVGFNQDVFSFYKKLIQIRKTNPALIDGSFEFVQTDGGKLTYQRALGSNKLIVMFNLENTKQKFSMPKAKYLNLLSNKKIKGNSVELMPLECVILRKN
jgi:cyclomaltodextrinase / maltogenic alpha-amylase / neopullulanase